MVASICLKLSFRIKIMCCFVIFLNHFARLRNCCCAHSTKTNRTLQEPCPQLDENKTNVRFYPMTEDGRLCPGAPAGHRIVGPCIPENCTSTQIERCEEGSYIAEDFHNRKTCDLDDVICEYGFIKISSTSDAAPRCVCPNWHYKTKNNRCKRHSPCPPGKGVVRLGTQDRDTVCRTCLHGEESPNNSTFDPCLVQSKYLTFSENSSNETEEDHEVKPKDQLCHCGSEVWSTSLIIVVITMIGTVLLIALAKLFLNLTKISCGFHPCSDSASSEGFRLANKNLGSSSTVDSRVEDDISSSSINGSSTSIVCQQSIPAGASASESPPIRCTSLEERDETIREVKEALIKHLNLASMRQLFRNFIPRPPQNVEDILNELERKYDDVDERKSVLLDKLFQEARSLNRSKIYQFYKNMPQHHDLITDLEQSSQIYL